MVLGLEGSGVVHLVGLFVFFFLLCGVSRPRGPASPRYGRIFFFLIFGVGKVLPSVAKKISFINYINKPLNTTHQMSNAMLEP